MNVQHLIGRLHFVVKTVKNVGERLILLLKRVPFDCQIRYLQRVGDRLQQQECLRLANRNDGYPALIDLIAYLTNMFIHYKIELDLFGERLLTYFG